MNYPRVQVAGVIDLTEAEMLLNLGVDDLGFPFGIGVRQVDLTTSELQKIAKALKPPNFGVLITYLTQAALIHGMCQELGLRKVQLHAEMMPAEVKKLKELDPELYVIKSLVVGSLPNEELLRQVNSLSQYVDAFITDTFNPATRQRGATGMTHDWDVSGMLVERSPKPILLAGGLTPANVGEGIRIVRPAGVDAHTGLENSSGRKDETLVREFVKNAKAAFEELKTNP